MPVPVDLPGLDQFIEEVPDGRILVLEGSMDPASSHLALHLATRAARAGRAVTFVSTRTGEPAQRPEIVGGGPLQVAEQVPWMELNDHAGTGDVVVDSFSFSALDVADHELASGLGSLRKRLRQTGNVAVLTLERGMLDARAAAIVYHLADGIIQFHAREDAEGSVQYLRVPKWMGGRTHIRNIYFEFDGSNLLIDTRRRVG
ncbi:MAG: hypothetical protein ACPGQL_04655 [Thermoplasmatota archaeon]